MVYLSIFTHSFTVLKCKDFRYFFFTKVFPIFNTFTSTPLHLRGKYYTFTYSLHHLEANITYFSTTIISAPVYVNIQLSIPLIQPMYHIADMGKWPYTDSQVRYCGKRLAQDVEKNVIFSQSFNMSYTTGVGLGD